MSARRGLAVLVQHHPTRANLLPDLLARLVPLPVEVVSDPEPGDQPNVWRSYRLALERFPEEATHALIVQDDAILCRDFGAAVPSAIAAAQDFTADDPLVAMWIPGGRRVLEDIRAACGRFVRLYTRPTCPVVATVWPRAARDAFLASAPAASHTPVDMLVGWWVFKRVPVVGTVPSLVEHDSARPGVNGCTGDTSNRRAALYIGEERSAREVFPA